jgi:hypothetical protein
LREENGFVERYASPSTLAHIGDTPPPTLTIVGILGTEGG